MRLTALNIFRDHMTSKERTNWLGNFYTHNDPTETPSDTLTRELKGALDSHAILNMFVWKDTVEGHKYWFNINRDIQSKLVNTQLSEMNKEEKSELLHLFVADMKNKSKVSYEPKSRFGFSI